MNIRYDHWIHFNVCFWITALSTIPWFLFHKEWMLYLPFTMGFIAGFYKEFKDIKTTGFDWTDIAADAVGILAALCLFGLSIIGGSL